jgi:hypothetical protein
MEEKLATPTEPTSAELQEYLAEVLPTAHGHQRKALADFILAIIERQTGNQADLTREMGNQEAALKRLSRLIHNPRLNPRWLADMVLAHALRQLPARGRIRLTIDWTSEGDQHLLVISPVCRQAGWSLEAARCPSIGGRIKPAC